MNKTQTNRGNEMTKTINLGSGIKRIINLLNGRDVIICGSRGRWVMHANFNQPDARVSLGEFASVADCVRHIKQKT